MINAAGLAAALSAWQTLLGSDRVLAAAGAMQRYGSDNSGPGMTLAGALLVKERAEVTAVVETARRHHVPLYPISTGNNWGYGGASPVCDGCVLLDLSGMDRIVEMDQELGLVTLEPGVTQGKLREYLDRHAPGFMVPTTGAGPNCSLVGNALERGYGITPNADHFGAVSGRHAEFGTASRFKPAGKHAAIRHPVTLVSGSGSRWDPAPLPKGFGHSPQLGLC